MARESKIVKNKDRKAKKKTTQPITVDYIPNLQNRYINDVIPSLTKRFNYMNIMEAVSYTHLTLPTNREV